jgi:hypothetical protein
MKKLITVILFIFISNLTFSQIKRAGSFYELSDLWKKDSVSVKQLITKFDLNITKLDTVQFFKQFDLNKDLHTNYSYECYIYKLDKKTNTISMKEYFRQGLKPKLNKYVMVFCFDNDNGEKIINIKIF